MANFDLGLAKCRVRERASGTQAFYFKYIVKNDFDIDDETNIYVKSLFELEEIRTNLTDKCKTEADTQALMSRVTELRKFIDEVK